MDRPRGGVIAGSLVLDAEGLIKLASGHKIASTPFEAIRRQHGHVVTAATTLTEVLRGGPRDATIHRILNKVTVVSIDTAQARKAGELLGRSGLSGHRCALDALLATVALVQPRPIVLLTSDTADMAKLTAEPERPARERILILRV